MSHCCFVGWCDECEDVERDVHVDMPPRSVERYIMVRMCLLQGCPNESRYTSGFCGLHDIELNQGLGKRLSDAQ